MSASAAVFLAVLGGLLAARWLLLSRLRSMVRRTSTDWDDLLVEIFARIHPVEYALIAVYLAARSMALPAAVDKIIHIVFVVALSLRGASIVMALLGHALARMAARAGLGDPHSSSVVSNLRFVLGGAVWLGVLIFVLDNLGVNITAAVAGLGIGGIAVAMGAQQILGDLFSSFVIFMDQPFRVGDFITVGELSGTVEHIGIKTTRVRSLGGEILVFSNSDLTRSRIRNYQLLQERRAVFQFSLAQDTPHDKLKAVPGMIREIVARHPKARLDRAHFKAIAAASLDFEVVYYALSADYNVYMDLQQDISLDLLRRLAAEDIRLAHSGQTVLVAKASS